MSEKHCEHYSVEAGLQPVCARGIPISQRFKPKWPCWTGNAPPESSATCPFFLAPTAEQLAERERDSNAAMVRTLLAFGTVEAWELENGKAPLTKVHAIDCPNCKTAGVLRFMRSRDHLYIGCATPKCVNVRANLGRR